ncbi:MAG TPA: hypothetical protein VK253_03410 [Candidatus Binatia bacterium]|nr:hypothetical protein [Candidatus Binatia bacterium]
MSELVGDVSLGLNVLSVFLVGIGVVGRRGSRKTLLKHGYLSIAGFALKLATVFTAMIPDLLFEFPQELAKFSVFQTSFLAVKVTLGIAGTIMGFICLVPWLLKHREQNSCLKVKRWMMPTLIVWIIAVVFGAAVHLGGIL